MQSREFIYYLRGQGGSSNVWPYPPPVRGACPPIPGITLGPPSQAPQDLCWRKAAIATDMPSGWPGFQTRDLMRTNFCPWIPDGLPPLYSDGRRIILSWDLPQYKLAAEHDLFYRKFAGEDGYDQAIFSLQQTLNNGGTYEDLLFACRAAQLNGRRVVIVCFGAPDDYFNSWDKVQPWLDRLIADGGLVPGQDYLCACWQIEKWWDPLPALEVVGFPMALYAKRHGFITIIHYLGDGTCWYDAPDSPRFPNTCSVYGICNRWTYPSVLGPISSVTAQTIAVRLGSSEYLELAGETYPHRNFMQTAPGAPIDEVQSAAVKVLVSLTTQELDLSECTADTVFARSKEYPEVWGDFVTRLALGASYGTGLRTAAAAMRSIKSVSTTPARFEWQRVGGKMRPVLIDPDFDRLVRADAAVKHGRSAQSDDEAAAMKAVAPTGGWSLDGAKTFKGYGNGGRDLDGKAI